MQYKVMVSFVNGDGANFMKCGHKSEGGMRSYCIGTTNTPSFVKIQEVT